MSLPHTNRETLLSAALDGELSVQEQLEFDRALATDASFAQEYAELQSLRLDLKATLNRLREQPPTQDFASRIVAAAFEQHAPTTGGNRLRPTIESPEKNTRQRGLKSAAVVGALAASLLLALGMWYRDLVNDAIDQPMPQALAELKPSPPLQDDAPEAISATIPGETARLDQELFASDVPRAEPSAPISTEASIGNEPPKVMGIKPMPESVASVQPNVNSNSVESDAIKPSPQTDREPLSLVLVLAVELTEQGREQLILQEALGDTGIRLGEQSIVGSQVVSHLKDTQVISSDAEGKQAKLYFIEASTKQIDRLVTRLMTSPEAISSVGLTLAMDPPLLAAVGDLREIDPTKVRQDAPIGLARDVRAAGDAPISFDSGAFAPIDRGTAMSDLLQTQPSANAAASGDDSPSQLLLFVK